MKHEGRSNYPRYRSLWTTLFGYNFLLPFQPTILHVRIIRGLEIIPREKIFLRRNHKGVFASFDTSHGTMGVLCHRKLRQCYRIISSTIRLPVILFTRGGKHGYSCVIRVMIRIKYRTLLFKWIKIYFVYCWGITFSIVGNIFRYKIVHTWMNRRER